MASTTSGIILLSVEPVDVDGMECEKPEDAGILAVNAPVDVAPSKDAVPRAAIENALDLIFNESILQFHQWFDATEV